MRADRRPPSSRAERGSGRDRREARLAAVTYLPEEGYWVVTGRVSRDQCSRTGGSSGGAQHFQRGGRAPKGAVRRDRGELVTDIGCRARAVDASRYADNALVRLESVRNTNDQSTVVAKVLTATVAAYDTVPWFWSNQYDLRLQSVGLSR